MPTRRSFLGASALLAAPAILALARPLGAQAALEGAVERARGLEPLHGLIVMQGGAGRVAEHLRGPALDRPANVKSVSKSIVATLLGCAIGRGEVPGVGATLGEVAPGLIPAGADARVARITLEDLVTLRAGLERTSGPNYGAWVSSRNWVADALSRPFEAEPGGRMLYSTGTTHVLGAVLAEVSGQSLLELARERLGRPLGFEVPAWTRDPQGYYLGGNEMAIAPEGLARLGEMLRRGGVHEGARLVPEDWLRESFVPRTRSPWSGLAYGYGWFLGEAAGGRYALARGYGGQVLAVAPAQEAVVVITSDPTQPARSGGYFGELLELLERDILGALG